MSGTETPIEEVLEEAVEVLMREMGPAKTGRILAHFAKSKIRDYTKERHKLLPYKTIDEILADIKKMNEAKNAVASQEPDQ